MILACSNFPNLSTTTSSPLLGVNFEGNLWVNDSHVPPPTLLREKLPYLATIWKSQCPWTWLQGPAFTQIPPLLSLFSLHSQNTSGCILVVVVKFIFINNRRALELLLQNALQEPKCPFFRQVSSCSHCIITDDRQKQWNLSAFDNTIYFANLQQKYF